MVDLRQPSACPADLITGGKRPNRRSGTRLAIIDTIPSCGSSPAGRGWGGARNRADRTSEHLTRRQCEGLIAAAHRAEGMGLAFNRHWTVHYERAGIAEADAARFIGRLLKLARDAARRKIGGFTAIWVRESGEGKGGHVHILMHLPAGLGLRGRTRKWVGLAGGECRKGVSVVRSIGGALISADIGGEHYRHNAGAVLAYVLKGAGRAAGEALGLPQLGEAGLVVGKRCGRTQNIGVASLERGNT